MKRILTARERLTVDSKEKACRDMSDSKWRQKAEELGRLFTPYDKTIGVTAIATALYEAEEQSYLSGVSAERARIIAMIEQDSKDNHGKPIWPDVLLRQVKEAAKEKEE